MSSNEVSELSGDQMSRQEIDKFLTVQGHGVLSLANQGDAYAVPISFGYDGESRLYFVYLRLGAESKKTSFSEQTNQASFLAYDVQSKFKWKSVLVSGPLEQVSEAEWETLLTTIDDNAWFPSLFSQAEPRQDILGWKLQIEEITGKKGEDY